MITAQQLRQLDERDVLLCLNHVQDHRPMGLDATRARVPAFGLRTNGAGLTENRNPADRGCNPDLELRRRRMTRQPSFNGCNHP